MDSASQGTTTQNGAGGGLVDVSLDYLKHIRHHFLTKVFRTTPSGRQQSAILLLLPDAICLLTHRGGLHTYIPIKSLVAISVYPRARITFHVARRHDLLITCAQQPRLVSSASQLYLGLVGAPLPVHQEESAPSLDRLQLRPHNEYRPEVTSSLIRLLRNAALTVASFGTLSVAAALVDPNADNSARAQVGDGTTGGGVSSSSLRVASQTVGANLHLDATAADAMYERTGSTDTSLLPSSSLAQQSATVSKLLHGDVAGSTRCTPLFADPSSGYTMLVIEGQASGSVLTLPTYRSVWQYLRVGCSKLPGATALPVLRVRCVEQPHKELLINSRLLHQTMLLLAEEHPHMVTLQKRKTDEGHQLDGSVLWLSLLETSR